MFPRFWPVIIAWATTGSWRSGSGLRSILRDGTPRWCRRSRQRQGRKTMSLRLWSVRAWTTADSWRAGSVLDSVLRDGTPCWCRRSRRRRGMKTTSLRLWSVLAWTTTDSWGSGPGLSSILRDGDFGQNWHSGRCRRRRRWRRRGQISSSRQLRQCNPAGSRESLVRPRKPILDQLARSSSFRQGGHRRCIVVQRGSRPARPD